MPAIPTTPKSPRRNPNFPTLITWTDPDGRVHTPPDPPLIEGCPPWLNRPNEYKRTQHLKKCPSGRCRRAQLCVDPHIGGFCQKTHLDAETFRRQLCQRIDRLLRSQGIEPDTTPLKPGEPIATPPSWMKRALQQACDDKEREALLKFQTDWINAQKRAYAARKINATQPSSRRKPGPTHHAERSRLLPG